MPNENLRYDESHVTIERLFARMRAEFEFDEDLFQEK